MDEAFSEVLSKYADFVDIFSSKLVIELLEYMGIHNHTIKLKDDWQPLYGLIYSFQAVKLETFKAYIKNNLANNFIRSFKFPAGTPIFFNKKPDDSLKLCMNYRGLNNLTIKNQYLLFLVGELLD